MHGHPCSKCATVHSTTQHTRAVAPHARATGDSEHGSFDDGTNHDPDESQSSEPAPPPAPDKRGPMRKRVDSCLDLLNSTALQTVLYLIFVLVFQMILEQLRIKEEFYFDKVRACGAWRGVVPTVPVASETSP